MLVNTQYRDYQELLLDLDIFGRLVSGIPSDKEDYKRILWAGYEKLYGKPKLEDERYKLSRIVSSDYHIGYSSSVELLDGEELVSASDEVEEEQEYIDIVAFDRDIDEYENKVRNSSIEIGTESVIDYSEGELEDSIGFIDDTSEEGYESDEDGEYYSETEESFVSDEESGIVEEEDYEEGVDCSPESTDTLNSGEFTDDTGASEYLGDESEYFDPNFLMEPDVLPPVKTIKKVDIIPEEKVDRSSEPTDIVEFVRKHRNCEVSFALKYFNRKEVERALLLGRIVKRRNRLRV